jgi:septum formation protein
MKTIILASASPRRKQLLKQLGLEFKIIPSEIEEKLNPRWQPRKQVEVLSEQKAQAVATKHKNAIVIGVDTMVAYNNEVIGKPKDEKDAKMILKKLSGKQQLVITAFTIIDMTARKSVTKSVETKVWFRRISEPEIRSYIAKEKPYDKAGAYGMQTLGAVFVEKVEGDFLSAVGLPLFTLAKELKKFGVDVL